jgi:hypothetical protein
MRMIVLTLLAGCLDRRVELPTCEELGCDGTPERPAEDDGPPVDGACFCPAPAGSDGRCVP